jgi:molybdopterin/thiamine biosynthesis adenylyltransferase
MMQKFTLTMLEKHSDLLKQIIFAVPGLEGAAYLMCGISRTEQEVRLLVREVIPVKPEHYLVRESDRLSIASESYVPVAKQSKLNKEAVIFVHSHPSDYPEFSPADNIEEPKLLAFLQSRCADVPHGSMVCSGPTPTFNARIWCDGTWADIERIRFIGRRFRIVDKAPGAEPLPEFFDRQVRAFGPQIQRLLGSLHIGVPGVGGTGSATVQQLVRLGVGRVSVFDGDVLAASNVTRVHGSSLEDVDRPKAVVQAESLNRIGFDTEVIVFPKHITVEETAKHLRDCDFIFGCTDKHSPRGILVRLALRYLIPVIDMAVRIDSKDQIIRGIWGRVTTILPGEACLFCRETITARHVRAESLPPDQLEAEIREGYAPELGSDEPAVVMFTTAVAAQAVSELLHRLTGFMGEDRVSSEVILHFHESRIRTNRRSPKADCMCMHQQHWGRGDTRNFLGVTW